MLGKWFRKRVAEPLVSDVIPDTARAVENPIRRAQGAADSAATAIPGGEFDGGRRLGQSVDAASPPAAEVSVTPAEHVSAEFSPAMSGSQVHATLAELLGDRGAAEIAALPVNHGLRIAGRDGVRLFCTPATGGSGATVSGWVEEVRIPPGGILEDTWGGARIGEFTFARPEDGTATSWSARMLGDRKQIGRTAERLPAELAGVTAGFDTEQIRSTVADAAERMSKDKTARRGGALDIEGSGDRLTVRASAGVLSRELTAPEFVLLDSTLTRTEGT